MRLLALAAITALIVASTVQAAPPAIGIRTFRFVDQTRTVRFRTGAVGPRTLVTSVRYPRTGGGPVPLVVFAHGFALTPGIYARLLDAWARAGYVVAAPTFPLESPNAPGGPSQSDLVNEPGDIRFVITQLLAGPLRNLIDARRIAVAGHSDGGVAALAAAYGSRSRDRRIDAAIIMSGAQSPTERFDYAKGTPPLLAVQGSADTINNPGSTRAFFAVAHRPKFLLWLLGSEHRAPYTTNTRELVVVERATIAFLNRYLRNGPLRPLLDSARAGEAQLTPDP